MLTVRIYYINGNEDIKECWDVSDICLDGVASIKVIRDERKKAA